MSATQLDLLAEVNVDPWWLDGALRAIETLAATGRTFQAYDLLALGVAEPDRPAAWGAAFYAAKAKGLIESVGYAPSKRPTVRGSACREWRGVAR